jgi:hypothetical protein
MCNKCGCIEYEPIEQTFTDDCNPQPPKVNPCCSCSDGAVCKQKIPAKCTQYNGPALNCLNLISPASVEEIIIRLNNIIIDINNTIINCCNTGGIKKQKLPETQVILQPIPPITPNGTNGYNWFNKENCQPCTQVEECKKQIPASCVIYNGPILNNIDNYQNVDVETLLATYTSMLCSLKSSIYGCCVPPTTTTTTSTTTSTTTIAPTTSTTTIPITTSTTTRAITTSTTTAGTTSTTTAGTTTSTTTGTTSTTTEGTTSTTTAGTTSTTTQYVYCDGSGGNHGTGTGCKNWNIIASTGGCVVSLVNCSGVNVSITLNKGDIRTLCGCSGVNPTLVAGIEPTMNQVADCVSTIYEWYIIENCFQPGQYIYTTRYAPNTFTVGQRVISGLDVFTVVNILNVDPVGNNLSVTAALNPDTNAKLTGCPKIVQIDLFPYYDDLSLGDKIRGIWSTPAVAGPELGFTGRVSRYSINGCSQTHFTDYTYFAPGGTNAIALDNGVYQDQSSCFNLSGTSPESLLKLKISQITIYTQATPFDRNVDGCPIDFSTATQVVTTSANNYSGTYRFSIYDASASDYIYFSILGCFSCPL